VWNNEVFTTLVRPSPRSSNVSGFDADVAGHAVPLKRADTAFGWSDLAVTPLEPVNPVRAMLNESPVTAAFNLHPFDDELVAAAPPLRDQ
jgi:hypothetical protein